MGIYIEKKYQVGMSLKIEGREGIINGMKSLENWKMMGSNDKNS